MSPTVTSIIYIGVSDLHIGVVQGKRVWGTVARVWDTQLIDIVYALGRYEVKHIEFDSSLGVVEVPPRAPGPMPLTPPSEPEIFGVVKVTLEGMHHPLGVARNLRDASNTPAPKEA